MEGINFLDFYFGDDLAAAEIFAPRANFLQLRQLSRVAPAAGMDPFFKAQSICFGVKIEPKP